MTDKPRTETHIIAGLGGPFTSAGTKALEKLIDDLPALAGADHHYHGQYMRVYRGVVARAAQFGDASTVQVILIGLSWGCLRALQLASMLKVRGIRIKLIVAIDPTAYPGGLPVLTDNVDRVIEIWSSKGPFNFPLNARKKIDGSAGGKYRYPHGYKREIVNVPTRHIASAAHPITRNIILKEVGALLK